MNEQLLNDYIEYRIIRIAQRKLIETQIVQLKQSLKNHKSIDSLDRQKYRELVNKLTKEDQSIEVISQRIRKAT